jgi:hypothetical protein
LICSWGRSTILATTDDPANLRRADPDELRLAISMALQRDGRRRFRHGDDLMANLVADHLVRYLPDWNYVILRRSPAPGHTTLPVGPKGPR